MATGGALACEVAIPFTPDYPQPMTTPRRMAAIMELTRGLGIASFGPHATTRFAHMPRSHDDPLVTHIFPAGELFDCGR